MNKITLWLNVCANDWTAERAIIASNGRVSEFEFELQDTTDTVSY